MGFRQNYNPGHYNMRFKPSQGIDNNYVHNTAPFHGANGPELVSAIAIAFLILMLIDQN